MKRKYLVGILITIVAAAYVLINQSDLWKEKETPAEFLHKLH